MKQKENINSSLGQNVQPIICPINYKTFSDEDTKMVAGVCLQDLYNRIVFLNKIRRIGLIVIIKNDGILNTFQVNAKQFKSDLAILLLNMYNTRIDSAYEIDAISVTLIDAIIWHLNFIFPSHNNNDKVGNNV